MVINNKERIAYASMAEALEALADLSTNWKCDATGATVFQCEQCHRFHIDFEGIIGRRKPTVPVRLYPQIKHRAIRTK